ncbi:MAG: hypothetical protein LBT79_07080 [Elusimicrobiota bacterium]|nr:hypothetical protein [Elusimicrobiota bacterium]
MALLKQTIISVCQRIILSLNNASEHNSPTDVRNLRWGDNERLERFVGHLSIQAGDKPLIFRNYQGKSVIFKKGRKFNYERL